MTKLQFLLSLHQKLSSLPRDEAEERLSFYSEMIEDRMEEGLSEAEAVAAVGTVEEIAAQITGDIPRQTPKRQLKTWEVVLLAAGSPVWFSLLVAAFAVVFSLYVVLWSIIISFWAVFVSLAACALAGVTAGAVFTANGNIPSGLALIGAGAVCAGLSIFFFIGCRAATQGAVLLTQKITLWLKNRFTKKEAAA